MCVCVFAGVWAVWVLLFSASSFEVGGWLPEVDGLLPRGIHQVIRIQKFVQGGFSARHIDRPIRLQDQAA